MLRDILTTSSGQQIVLLIFTKALFSSMLEYKIQINPGHFADSVEKTLATKHVRIEHLITNQVNTRYRCLKLSVVQFNTPLSVLSKLLFTLSAAIISPRFLSSAAARRSALAEMQTS